MEPQAPAKETVAEPPKNDVQKETPKADSHITAAHSGENAR